MFDIRLSTQFKNWLYESPARLEKIRREANQRARQALLDGEEAPPPLCFAAAMGRSPPEGANTGTQDGFAPQSGQKRPRQETPSLSEADLPTIEDELALVQYSVHMIQDACGPRSESIKRGVAVQATAITYFKRFYLSNSVIDFDPKIAVQACIFLAAKVECEYVKLAEIKEVFDEKLGKASQVIEFEAKLLQGLGFCLKTFHPYNPFLGLIHGFENVSRQKKLGVKGEEIEHLANVGQETLDLIVVTDLSFLYTPARIALAVFIDSAEALGLKAKTDQFLEQCFGDEDEYDDAMDEVNKILAVIRAEKEGPASLEDRKDEAGAKCRPVLSKLRKCARWSSGKAKKKARASSPATISAGAASSIAVAASHATADASAVGILEGAGKGPSA